MKIDVAAERRGSKMKLKKKRKRKFGTMMNENNENVEKSRVEMCVSVGDELERLDE